MKVFRIALVGVSLLCTASLYAQRAQDWLALGDEAMLANDPFGALRYYREAFLLDSTRALHNYKYAETLRLNHNYPKAAYYYQKVYRRDMDRQYPEAGMHLATMQKQSGRYTDAKQTWRRVRDRYSDAPDAFVYQKAVQELRACDLAAQWIQDEGTATIRLAAPPVNSDASEFAAGFRNDGSLYFTSLRGTFDPKGRLKGQPSSYRSAIFETDPFLRGITTWHQVPEQIAHASSPVAKANLALNETEELAAVVLNEGGTNRIVVFETGGNQQLLLELPLEGDSAWYSHPSFGTLDGTQVLFFASDRAEGYGMKDIWYLYIDRPAQLYNAGPEINSPGNEVTPFYQSDEQRLYFASDWHYGLGGFDIFYSEVTEGGFSWPENMKRPFNSPANDLYYSYNATLRRGTITSNRVSAWQSDDAGCCNDIYYFELPEPEVPEADEITLEDLNALLPVKLYFHNDEPDPRTTREESSQNYLTTYRAYTAMLPMYEAEYKRGLNADAGEAAEEAMDQFFVNEIDKGVAHLATFTSLLLKELEEGHRIALTVKGFASPLARTDYNVKLTSRRISTLVNFLREYERGALLPYLNGTAPNGGLLSIISIPFGEYRADAFVSDNPNDKASAIYSIAAARERKIEISSVQVAPEDSTTADVRFITEIADLGTLHHTDSVPFSFEFGVYGAAIFTIDSLIFDSSSIWLHLPNTAFLTGSGYKLEGTFYPQGKKGKQYHTIICYGNIASGRKELNIALEKE